MKLKYFICCTLLSGAFALSSCDKDDQHQPTKIYIDYGTKEYEYSDYYIDDYWLVTLVQYGSDNITNHPPYNNICNFSL